jgi:SOS-response transcriptional repressor LexA
MTDDHMRDHDDTDDERGNAGDAAPDSGLEEMLVELASAALIREPDSAYYTDRRFIDWLHTDLNRPERRDEGWSDQAIQEVADRVRASVMAKQVRVERRWGAPPQMQPRVAGTPPQVLDAAASARAAPRVDLAAAAGVGRDLWDEPCEQWVELPPEVEPGKYIAIRIAGDSMIPLFHAGDTVLVKIGVTPMVDTIVLARLADGGYVVKRVSRVMRSRIELSSFNPDYPPLMVARQAETVIGTIVLRWCPHERAPGE